MKNPMWKNKPSHFVSIFSISAGCEGTWQASLSPVELLIAMQCLCYFPFNERCQRPYNSCVIIALKALTPQWVTWWRESKAVCLACLTVTSITLLLFSNPTLGWWRAPLFVLSSLSGCHLPRSNSAQASVKPWFSILACFSSQTDVGFQQRYSQKCNSKSHFF